MRCEVCQRLKHLHANDLKEWNEPPVGCGLMDNPDDLPERDLPWSAYSPADLRPQIDMAVPLAQVAELSALLRDFPSLFSLHPGHTSLVQHHIPTPPGQVIRTPLRPLPLMRWEAIDKEVEEMLALGVIVPSHSDWRSPIVLVPKPDGSIHFCVDFWEVNCIAKFDAYPMPRTDVLLDRLGSAKILSALDLTKRYWQVPVADEEKKTPSQPHGACSTSEPCPSTYTGLRPPFND